MKILWLYKYAPRYNFDKWFHLEYAKSIANTKGLELKAYGLNIHEGYPELAVTDYHPLVTLEAMRSAYNFDVVICNTKSRMFDFYHPACLAGGEANEGEGTWLPLDFASWTKTPKIMIEEDFHYEDSNDWYIDMGFDIILQRHKNNAVVGNLLGGIEHRWHPFSVDTNVFKFKPPRYYFSPYNMMGFMGSDTEVYAHRKKVLDSSLLSSYIQNYASTKRNLAYIEGLSLTVCSLSGASIYNITPAKMFEIMASESILVTNEGDYGLKELFPDNSYLTYSDDMVDLKQKLDELFKDKNKQKQMKQTGLQHIKAHHTHEIRTQELINIIRELNLEN